MTGIEHCLAQSMPSLSKFIWRERCVDFQAEHAFFALLGDENINLESGIGEVVRRCRLQPDDTFPQVCLRDELECVLGHWGKGRLQIKSGGLETSQFFGPINGALISAQPRLWRPIGPPAKGSPGGRPSFHSNGPKMILRRPNTRQSISACLRSLEGIRIEENVLGLIEVNSLTPSVPWPPDEYLASGLLRLTSDIESADV